MRAVLSPDHDLDKPRDAVKMVERKHVSNDRLSPPTHFFNAIFNLSYPLDLCTQGRKREVDKIKLEPR